MIEGLRVYPAYQDARGEGLVPRSCKECKANTMVETRQAMGCGYEPAIKGAAPWTPRAQIEAGSTNTTCPGYTTSLPVVREVVDAYIHWERGTLADVIGARPTPTALHCLTALAAGSNEQRDQRLRDLREQRGGGG